MSRESIVVDPSQETGSQSAAPTTPKQGAGDPLADLKLPTEGLDPTYAGKTVRDIITMHENAVRKIGEQGNEVGTWRKMVQELSSVVAQQQSNQTKAQEDAAASAPSPALTGEELLTNPTDAIGRAVGYELEKRIKPLEENLSQQTHQQAVEKLIADFPDLETTQNDPEFVEWVNKTQSRRQLADAVRGGDVSAARNLLEGWEEIQSYRKPAEPEPQKPEEPQRPPSGVEGARRVATESGNSSGSPAKPMLNGQDFIDMMIRNPDKYHSAEVQAQLREAAKEGRLKL